MYYNSVNRGIFFTKSGIYALGFVLLVGLLASGSGSNALYLSLSLALSILVVSGILSEKVIQNIEISLSKFPVAENHLPFDATITLKNRSQILSLFGIEVLVIGKTPRFKLFSDNVKKMMNGEVLQMRPLDILQCHLSSRGLERGAYSDLYAVIRTQFPFGLIIKFRVEKISSTLFVTPSLDVELAKKLRENFQSFSLAIAGRGNFQSHRLFRTGDSAKVIDWKKSAGKPPSDWMVKQFEDPRRSDEIEIYFSERTLRSLEKKQQDQFLSGLYTFARVADENGKKCTLSFELGSVKDVDKIYRFLASYPVLDSTLYSKQSTEAFQKVVFSGSDFQWVQSL